MKYTETLGEPPAEHRPRYDELPRAMGCFDAAAMGKLRASPLQQMARDHMLAGSMLLGDDYEEGTFVFLSPRLNEHCANAALAYRACLVNEDTFQAWTLEDIVAAIKSKTKASWIESFDERYLQFDRPLNLARTTPPDRR